MIIAGDRSKKDSQRVVRGGSWNNNGRNVRSAIRNRNTPDNRNNNIGFRLALAQQAMNGLNDQIVIPSCRWQANNKAAGTLVMVVDAAINACRTVALSHFTADF